MGRAGTVAMIDLYLPAGLPHHLNLASPPPPLSSLPSSLRLSVRHRIHREVARPAFW